MMISEKGREEIRKLIASDLVETWAETDRSLANVVKMLLSQRPDLIELYFHPVVWQWIRELEKRPAASVILALLKAAVIAESGTPSVQAWDQAVFYYGTRIPQYMDMALAWADAHPEECPYSLRSRHPTALNPPQVAAVRACNGAEGG